MGWDGIHSLSGFLSRDISLAPPITLPIKADLTLGYSSKTVQSTAQSSVLTANLLHVGLGFHLVKAKVNPSDTEQMELGSKGQSPPWPQN